MHLFDDAKLRWRSKVNDVQMVDVPLMWEELKKELRAQLFPEYVKFIARSKLREFRHMGTIRDYANQFSVVMLGFRDMSEKDKVFCFVEGLKLLFDYGGEQGSQKKNVTAPNLGNRVSKPNSPRNFANDKKLHPQASTPRGAHQ
ncbi:uncharacterized protein E6C27_scaffold17G001260 [Cucumis melo var. makuwa]|uniref:Retrotransposon gag domain-containing protein n=1 Tax=Cucumis melo var. makuwa TaxID=1194695 RepID=A0A5A7VI44_CUCMM|nr:uncharacterized protein E6C27_scaffold17G001260 [Cucumis melo var. makuwa]